MDTRDSGLSMAALPGRPWPGGGIAAGGADAELVERVRRGDARAQEALVREHYGRLLAVARRFFRRDEDARDAVQEAFLAAFRALDGFRGACQLSTWLHRIAVNACLMKLRAESRCPETSIEPLLPAFDETGHHVHAVPRWAPDAEACLRSREVKEQVHRAIDDLPLSYREVLLLRDIEELSTDEVAEALGITANAVKIRLHRARQALRTLLEPLLHARDSAARSAAADL